MKAYTGNRDEATKATLEADPVAGAVWRLLTNSGGEWTGTATGLWKALGELVDEDVRHTKAWPAAPNTLTNRLKRLAPNLRQVDIEYGDYRESGSGRRLKSLKKVDAKDRHSRHHRHSGEETPANKRNPTVTVRDDGVTVRDDAATETVTGETPANAGFCDDVTDCDDALRPYSNPGESEALADTPAEDPPSLKDYTAEGRPDRPGSWEGEY
jgi:hypothetical protein